MSAGGRRLVVGYVVKERVNGWKARVVVENLAAGECGCGVDAVLSWEPGAGGNKLKESSSLGEVIDQAV